jgi:hypothetical protein
MFEANSSFFVLFYFKSHKIMYLIAKAFSRMKRSYLTLLLETIRQQNKISQSM